MLKTARAALLLFCAIASPDVGFSGESDPPTNLKVLQRLAAEVGTSAKGDVSLDRTGFASFRVFPAEFGWAFERDLADALGIGSAPLDSLGPSVEVGITGARVVYEDTRRDGLFGPKVVDRVVTFSARVKVEYLGSLARHTEYVKTSRDTVRLAAIEDLESPALPMTKGALPNAGIFDDLLEPLVVLGSLGVAVYLLFAVRS